MRRLLIALLACFFAVSAAHALVGPRRTLLSGKHIAPCDPMVLTVACGAPAYAVDVQSLTSNLVGYWRQVDTVGSGTVKDYSSGLNNATVTGTVTLGSTGLIPATPASTSGLFAGGYETLASSSILNWEYTQPWTVEMLVKPNVTRSGTGTAWALFSKMQSAAPLRGFEIGLNYNQGGGFCVNINCISIYMINTFATNLYIQVISTTTDVTNGAVHHIVVSYTGSGTAAGFSVVIDGIQQAMHANKDGLAGNTIVNAVLPTIGARNAGAAIPFAGNIQELAVYNASITQATTSFLATSHKTLVTTGAVFGHYGVDLLGRAPIAPYVGVPNVIMDTEGFNDAEAPIGIALAAVMHKRGEINLIGAIEDGIHDYGADADYAILKWVLPSISTSFVGAWQGSVPGTPADTSVYATLISSIFGTNVVRSTYTDGVQKMRALLASQPDHSVTITAGGYYTILDGLLTSAANAGGDGLPSGHDLIVNKVFRLIPVAVCYQSPALGAGCGGIGSFGGSGYNAAQGPAANAAHVFATWPGEIVETGIEVEDPVRGGPAQLTTNGTTAAGNNTLHFAAVTNITPGMIIYDKTTTGLIPPGTTVVSTTSTTVVMSANATGAEFGGTDVIAFNGGWALPVQITTNGTTAAGNNTLHFVSTTGAVDGQLVSDITNSALIPGGTYVVSHTGTTVVMSANAAGAGVGGTDLISFNGGPVNYAWSKYNTLVNATIPPEPMWNEMNILYAARGPNSGMEVAGLRGTNTLNTSTAVNLWTPTAGNSSYVTAFASVDTFKTFLNNVYKYLPGTFP